MPTLSWRVRSDAQPETASRADGWRISHHRFAIRTCRPTEFVDVTELAARIVRASGVQTGLLTIQPLHTTTGVVVNEHEPLLIDDFARSLESFAPTAGPYRHDDLGRRTVNLVADERRNGHSHCRALILASSVCLAVIGGRPELGRWQRIFVVELDGPQERTVSALVQGTATRVARVAHRRPRAGADAEGREG